MIGVWQKCVIRDRQEKRESNVSAIWSVYRYEGVWGWGERERNCRDGQNLVNLLDPEIYI